MIQTKNVNTKYMLQRHQDKLTKDSCWGFQLAMQHNFD
jgi:hypothetical protein